jgi:uncharacterized iron-regulated membrane protein
MPFLSDLLKHPRRLMLRRALFQVHLWLGIFLSVYVALIGLSGSALVFEDELRAHSTRDLHADPTHLAGAPQILRAAQKAYPGETLTYLAWPSSDTPAYTLYLHNAADVQHSVLADATDGHFLTSRPSLFIDTVHDFHVYLLMGRTGFIINCVAGIGLLVLALSGVVLWWPGLRLWFRGFRVSLRGSWKRINYDLHNVIGILTLAIVSFWGVTAIDFLWPTQTAKAVAFFSPLRGMKEPLIPESTSASKGTSAIDSADAIATVLSQVPALTPHASIAGVSLPYEKNRRIVAYVDTATAGDFSHRDIHTFDANTGRLLTTWHYGQNKTVGDWVLWLVYPLHFGTLWGLPIKILWCLLGLSLPSLSLTGLLMYWNRYLSKAWIVQ